MGSGVADQVPHNKEVGREPHVADDLELVVEPLHHFGGDGHAIALFGALDAQVAQIGRGSDLVGRALELVGYWELGEAGGAELDLDVGPLCDEEGVVAGLG